MNTKKRCTTCRNYYDPFDGLSIKVGLSGVCSSECLEDLKDKARRKRARRAMHREQKHKFSRRLPGQIRDKVRERDGSRCRFCGTSSEIQVHHIQYRSQGGGDAEWNLISLCNTHHQLMHSSKRTWQPVLQMVQYLYYFHDRLLTVPEAQRIFGEILAPPVDCTDADE